jgi:hypothetical protein
VGLFKGKPHKVLVALSGWGSIAQGIGMHERIIPRRELRIGGQLSSGNDSAS